MRKDRCVVLFLHRRIGYLRRLRLRVASAAVESGLCMSTGALPGPDLLRAIPGVLEGLRLVTSREATGGFRRAATKNAKTLTQIHIF